MDLTHFLRWVSRIRVLSFVAVAGGLALGITVMNQAFDPVLSIVLSIVSGVVFLAGIVGLLYTQRLLDDLEDSFHQNNFNLSMRIMESAHEEKTATEGSSDEDESK